MIVKRWPEHSQTSEPMIQKEDKTEVTISLTTIGHLVFASSSFLLIFFLSSDKRLSGKGSVRKWGERAKKKKKIIIKREREEVKEDEKEVVSVVVGPLVSWPPTTRTLSICRTLLGRNSALALSSNHRPQTLHSHPIIIINNNHQIKDQPTPSTSLTWPISCWIITVGLLPRFKRHNNIFFFSKLALQCRRPRKCGSSGWRKSLPCRPSYIYDITIITIIITTVV